MPSSKASPRKGSSKAASAAAEVRCRVDLRLLKGCYGWRAQGLDSGNIQVAAVGYFFFGPAAGQVSGAYSGSHGGNQVFRTFTGTVTVNRSTGFGFMEITDNANATEVFDFVTADQGKELYLTHKRPGTVVTYSCKKL